MAGREYGGSRECGGGRRVSEPQSFFDRNRPNRHGESEPRRRVREFDEHWSPRLAAELNGQAVKLAKLEGGFVWHHHDDADEMFLVTSGQLRIEFRDEEDMVLEEGELLVVPRGVEHRPVAEEEIEALLFEPTETTNTGNVENELTKTDLEQV